ncbi:MAG: Uma2 family endonuclease [Acidimicrobiales bacterium]
MTRAVVLDVPSEWMEERRRIGADVRDEMWDGELHMVPAPTSGHQVLSGDLYQVLAPLARARGMVAVFETGLYRPGADNDYRVPDQSYARPEVVSERGIEGAAELVVEILSPGDESRAKVAWYAAVGVREVLLVDPQPRRVELFAGAVGAVIPGPIGLALESLGAELTTVDGPRLRVQWDEGSADL